jgi:diguanylate cyclase (GGDEF)-like protein
MALALWLVAAVVVIGLIGTGITPPPVPTAEPALIAYTGVGTGVLMALLLSCAFCCAAIAWHQVEERSALWLALVFFGLAAMTAFHPHALALWQPALAPAPAERVALFAACWPPAALLLYYRGAVGLRELPALTPIIVTGSGLLGLSTLLLGADQLLPAIAAWWALQLGLALALLVDATLRRRRYALPMLVSLLPVLLAVTGDSWRHGVVGTFHAEPGDLWTPYAVALFVLAQIWIYIEKFSDAHRLAARLSLNLQEEVELRTRELRAQNDKLERAQLALQQANEALQLLSITDGLTQVHNRMYFEQRLAQEWRRCARQGLPLSALMIDADHFKRLNDGAGHLAGDRCLQALADTLRQQFRRAGELLARYGGEEFVVLLPDTNQTQALALAEALRIAVEALAVEHAGATHRMTVSIGVSTALPPLADQPAEQLLAAADTALYEAKESGRNRVHSLPLSHQRRLMAQQQLHL